MITGEITSARAKRILYPFLFTFLLYFIVLVVRWQMTGASGFTTGSPEGSGYSVVEHGRTLHSLRVTIGSAVLSCSRLSLASRHGSLHGHTFFVREI